MSGLLARVPRGWSWCARRPALQLRREAPSAVAPMSMLYRDGEHLGSELRLQNLARSGSLAAQHGLEHHAGDVSLQAAARLPAAHPLGALALHVGDRRRMHTRLRDGDHVDDGVEAAVAAAIESMARRLARGDRQG